MTQVLEHTHINIGERIDLTAAIDIQGSSDTGLPYGELILRVSNSTIDRYGESITMAGIDTSEVQPDRNPVVCWAHDYDALPIGKILKTFTEGDNLNAHIKLATDIYEFADTAYKLALGGYINACSIGGLVKSYGLAEDNTTDWSVIAELEMVELSLVPVPAHRDALVLARTLNMKPEKIKREYSDFVAGAMLKATKEFGSDEIISQIETLENLASVLRGTLATSSNSGGATLAEHQLKTRYTIAKSIQQSAEKIVVKVKTELKDVQNVRTNNGGNS